MVDKTPSLLTWKFITRILQHFEEGVVILDPEGDITVINSTARSLLKLEKLTSIKNVNDLPKELQEIWENRYRHNNTKRYLHNFDVEVNIVPGFGDGVAMIMKKRSSDLLHGQYEKLTYRELQAILDSSFDGIFITDGKGITLRVNEKCEIFYGISRDQLIGRHVKELEKEGVFSPSATAMAIEKRKNISVVQTTANGRNLLVQANIIWDENGEIYRVICSSKDITELSHLKNRFSQNHPLINDSQLSLDENGNKNGSLVAKSPVMKKLLNFASRVAQTESTVLLLGETGVGKGEIARYIHKNSQRSNGPFLMINCGALPDTLMESEIFGYDGGAFTGANKQGKIGFMELADGGTLFLDEIGELPLSLQVKLLHVLQDGTFTRIGGREYIRTDVRIIAATNQNLEELVRIGKFRKDLYYRLNVIPITIPPLRERPEDVIPLLISYLERIIEKNGRSKEFSRDVLSFLTKYNWPGNIRELQNFVEWMYVAAEDDVIDISCLPPAIYDRFRFNSNESPIVINRIIPLKEALQFVEQELIKKAQSVTTSTYQIAELLKVNQSTVVRKLNKIKSPDKEITLNRTSKFLNNAN
ncbi:sigma 54-interacting transcriptional regulator [Polycladomyces subterraneus]|uniref:Sigma 54-interacting transcriptional regulator n=1 Tax=Polycladomyces subterraneus TaxID=1016997 RepID=A0ABT8INY6_9BACL|nr:sigma 54-interacting transcriptional regulator [Polycladomyces subterraneus]MDN4594504.1 sigma 54-interacting transcriptional regulator [Polycladomyces subterraneus]